jgi:hypothetical protein
MSESESDAKWEAFKDYLRTLSPEKIEMVRKMEEDKALKEYEQFITNFDNGICYICGNQLDRFRADKPCIHWLLRPAGAKKRNIEEVFAGKGYFPIAAYIRWVCNQDTHFSKINDLKEEGNSDAIFHWTGEFAHVRWTFICTREDYRGHAGRRASRPHYHMEMRLNKQIFIGFNDFHCPFTDKDIFELRCNIDDDCPIKQSFGFQGAGMADAFSMDPEEIIKSSETTDNPKEAVYHIITHLSDPKGIPGEVIDKAVELARKTRKPIANALKEMGYRPSVIIDPPEDVPKKQNRRHPRKKTLDGQES